MGEKERLIERAIELLTEARALLVKAHTPRALKKVREAIKSTTGAARNAHSRGE